VLTDFTATPVAFVFCAGLNLGALVVALRLPEPEAHEVRRVRLRRSLWQALPFLRQRPTGWLVFAIVVAGLGTSMLAPVLRPYAVDTLGIEFSLFVLYMVPAACVAGLAFVPAGLVVDHFGRLRPLAVGMGLCGASLGVMGLAREPIVASFGACLALVGFSLIQPSWAAAILDRVPGEFRGTLMGAVTALLGAAGATGPALGGSLGDRLGAEAAFVVAGILLLAAACVVVGLIAAGMRDAPAEC
jgi:MFS family permease